MKSLNAAARHSHNFLVNKQHFKKHKASKEDTRARFNRKPVEIVSFVRTSKCWSSSAVWNEDCKSSRRVENIETIRNHHHQQQQQPVIQRKQRNIIFPSNTRTHNHTHTHVMFVLFELILIFPLNQKMGPHWERQRFYHHHKCLTSSSVPQQHHFTINGSRSSKCKCGHRF